MLLAAPLLALALSTPCPVVSRPWITEVLYDPAGDDTGHEFVELWNAGVLPRSLAGVRLEAGDGAGPGRWTLRWTGGAADSIAAGARFVIGGAAVAPAPNALVTLDLQNGPDAVRLVWPDGAIETVGWGALAHPEYACGDPAPDVASGMALARLPDDAMAGSNAADFASAPPTPGRANRAPVDAAIRAGSLALIPERPQAGAPFTLQGVLRNSGSTTLAAGACALEAVGRWLDMEGAAPVALGAALLETPLAPADSARVAVPALAPGDGKWSVALAVRLARDGDPANDADSLRVRIGRAPVEIAEIQFHPAAGEGEWIEVRAALGEGAHAELLRFSDRTGTTGRPEAGRAPLPAESLGVWCQNRPALLARFPALDTARVWSVAPWPSLNNSDDDTGVADEAIVSEDDGTPADRVSYRAHGVPAGETLERRDGIFWPSGISGGTPLRFPRAPRAIAGRFALARRRVAAGGETTLAWSLPFARCHVRASLHDLEGRRLRATLIEFEAGASGERVLALEGVPPGLYAITVEARDEVGAETITETHALRVTGSVP